MDLPQRAGIEDVPTAAGERQPVAYVGGRLGLGEGPEVIARRDALRQLEQLLAAEELEQLGLTDQDDLEELVPLGLEVREEAKLLERGDAQALGFVDDEDRPSLPGVGGQQVTVESVNQRLLAGRGPLVLHAELVADAGQELPGLEQRVEDQRDVDTIRESAQ